LTNVSKMLQWFSTVVNILETFVNYLEIQLARTSWCPCRGSNVTRVDSRVGFVWVTRGSWSAVFFCTFFMNIFVLVCRWSIACLNNTACWLLNGLSFSDLFGGQNLLAAHSFLSLLNPSTFVTCLFIKNVHLKAVKAVGHLTNNN